MDTLRDWLIASPKQRHRPPHRTDRGLALFVTASTQNRQRHLDAPDRRDGFRDLLRAACEEFRLQLVAWVILPDHYHAIVVPEGPDAFSCWINSLHRRSSTAWNREERLEGRSGWYDYWDRSLWTEGDLLSRVNYIHQNPVKHGYAADQADWPWSSHSEWLGIESGDDLLARFPAPRKLPHDDF